MTLQGPLLTPPEAAEYLSHHGRDTFMVAACWSRTGFRPPGAAHPLPTVGARELSHPLRGGVTIHVPESETAAASDRGGSQI